MQKRGKLPILIYDEAVKNITHAYDWKSDSLRKLEWLVQSAVTS